MLERMDPKTLVKWLIVAAIVYLVLPYDLLPDFLGLPGRIDDVLIMGWLAWFYRNHLQKYTAMESEKSEESEQEQTGRSKGGSAGQGAATGAGSSKAFDAYDVLGVTRAASSDAIQAAYRSRMQEYHPDKVAHLGEELQQLAHEKSQQIQRAYRQLRR
jgi:uncharacterized membrane protein YkvA (DUF1232 family)